MKYQILSCHKFFISHATNVAPGMVILVGQFAHCSDLD